EYKPAIEMRMFANEHGLLLWRSQQALLVRQISSLWDHFRHFTESARGELPIVELGERHEIVIGRGANRRSFFVPKLQITGWADRAPIPEFRDVPVTVPPPLPMDRQIAWTGAIVEQPRKSRGRPRKPQPAIGTSEMLDDALPW